MIRNNYNEFIQLKDISLKVETYSDSHFGLNKEGKIKLSDTFLNYCLSLEN